MTATISKSVSALILALVVFINSFGNLIGMGDIIETEPPTTTTTDPEWSVTYAGYNYNSEHDYYYVDDKECQQIGRTYDQFYSEVPPIVGMFIDQVRIRFSYEGKDWLIQMWKGQYGFLLVGSEITVFTAPDGVPDDIGSYCCPEEEDWLNICHKVYFKSEDTNCYERIITNEYGRYWWANGYVRGHLTKYTIPKTELKTASRITFKSKEMADLFVKGLNAAGFKNAADILCFTDDTYYQNGADVYIRWAAIHQDINVGNGDGEPVIITQ